MLATSYRNCIICTNCPRGESKKEQASERAKVLFCRRVQWAGFPFLSVLCQHCCRQFNVTYATVMSQYRFTT